MTNEQKILKELKKWLKGKEECFKQGQTWNRSRLFCKEVLDKIRELEKKYKTRS